MLSPVDTASEGGWLVEAEARREQRRVVEKPDEVLHRLVALVRRRLERNRFTKKLKTINHHQLALGRKMIPGMKYSFVPRASAQSWEIARVERGRRATH